MLAETMREPQFRDEKMLIFTEHRDTANYLANRLEAIGFTGQVALLHGGMDYRERDSDYADLLTAAVRDGRPGYRCFGSVIP
jgi:superfamily II DNA/RNA helicase